MFEESAGLCQNRVLELGPKAVASQEDEHGHSQSECRGRDPSQTGRERNATMLLETRV